jgi:hypothetical protein
MAKFFFYALALPIAVALPPGGAEAKNGGGNKMAAAGACTEAKFQACMNRCVSNMMISNGSRITQKCSNRCHKKC